MTPSISSTDKNILTFTLSALILSALIIGIVFTSEDDTPKNLFPSLDVILSKQVNNDESKDADFLAENNQQGGGDSEKAVRPQNIKQGISADDQGFFLKEQVEMKAESSNNSAIKTISTSQSEIKIENKIIKQNSIEVEKTNLKQEQKAQKLAKLENNISEKIEFYAKRPKAKYISASTKAFEFANYMHNWVKKIERISNLNYPEEARIRDFVGKLVMTVGINSNGKIEKIIISESSGFQKIDDAASHIVEISGPFEPLPENQKNIDILYITRTWQFLSGNKLKNL